MGMDYLPTCCGCKKYIQITEKCVYINQYYTYHEGCVPGKSRNLAKPDVKPLLGVVLPESIMRVLIASNEWYSCPKCEKAALMQGMNYCPECGTELSWQNFA